MQPSVNQNQVNASNALVQSVPNNGIQTMVSFMTHLNKLGLNVVTFILFANRQTHLIHSQLQ